MRPAGAPEPLRDTQTSPAHALPAQARSLRARLEDWTRRHWWRATPSAAAIALWPLAQVYRLLSAAQRLWWQAGPGHPARLPVPVVVVGNVVAGGAGKTPTVIALVQALQAQGWRPGIVSRGHGREGDTPRLVQADSPPRLVGDEPRLLWQRTGVPTAVGRKRAEAGRLLLSTHPDRDVLVCDDGLQHWRLARDAQVLVIDRRGIGNGFPLPAGPLRSPLPDPVPAHTVVLYNADTPSTALPGHLALRRLAGAQPLADWQRAPCPDPDALAALAARSQVQPIWAAAGIAEPGRFFDMLRAQGLVVQALALPDHHDFLQRPWPEGATVVLTEKDAVKLDPATRPRDQLWVVALDFQLPPALLAQLLPWLSTPRRATPASRDPSAP